MAEEEKATEMDLLAPEPEAADSVFSEYTGGPGEEKLKEMAEEKLPVKVPEEKPVAPPQEDKVKVETPVPEKLETPKTEEKVVVAPEPRESGAKEPNLEAIIREAVEGHLAEKTKGTVEPETPPAEDWQSRYYDTQRWSTQVQQENQRLSQQVADIEARLGRVNKKLRDEGVAFEDPVPRQATTQGFPYPTYVPPQQTGGYSPPVSPQTIGPQIDPQLSASLDSADRQFGQKVVNEYLLPGTGKFHKMAEADPSVRVKLSRSLDPCSDAIRETQKWEADQTPAGDNGNKTVDDIVSQVMLKIGVGRQPNGGVQQGDAPAGLDQIRSASGGSSKRKADVEAEPADFFGQYPGQR